MRESKKQRSGELIIIKKNCSFLIKKLSSRLWLFNCAMCKRKREARGEANCFSRIKRRRKKEIKNRINNVYIFLGKIKKKQWGPPKWNTNNPLIKWKRVYALPAWDHFFAPKQICLKSESRNAPLFLPAPPSLSKTMTKITHDFLKPLGKGAPSVQRFNSV